MYPGTSLVTKESNIEEHLRLILLNHPFFHTAYNFKLQDTLIGEQPESEFDLAVFEFLNTEGINYSDKIVEYWFQNSPPFLTPHCDYNFIYREKMKLEGPDWPHRVDKNLIVSPITIAVYLEVSDDLEGGELCISSRTWYEEDEPTANDITHIQEFPYESYKPKQGQVFYFRGSEHYHWIDKIKTGTRKSMLINFWPKELLDK